VEEGAGAGDWSYFLFLSINNELFLCGPISIFYLGPAHSQSCVLSFNEYSITSSASFNIPVKETKLFDIFSDLLEEKTLQVYHHILDLVTIIIFHPGVFS